MSSFSISAQYVYFLVALQRTAGDCPQHRSLSHFTSSLYVKFKNTVRLRNAEKFSKRERVVSQSVLRTRKILRRSDIELWYLRKTLQLFWQH